MLGLNNNPFRANFTKWSNTLKQFIDNLPTNCLSVFDHFVGLVLKGISFQLLIVLLHDVKRNLIIDFIKSGLELELFLIDSFQKTIRIRVYCATCLRWSYALHNIVPENIALIVNT